MVRTGGATVQSERRVTTSLRADPASVGAARRFVADVLASRGMEPLVDVAALLTSELVTNALLYTGSGMGLEIVFPPSSVRIEVRDTSTEEPVRRRVRPDQSVPGRGLELVESLAERWGTAASDAGKSVWFELEVPRRDGADELRLVQLLHVPAAAFVALNLHVDQLLHELQLVAVTARWVEASVGDRLHRLLTRTLVSHVEVRASAWAQAEEAMASHRERVDIELGVPADAAHVSRELLELLDEADRLCETCELLTLPAPAQARDLRRWVDGELWGQLELGRAPGRCPL
jgi:anti-sigma regulatory factor (Ser/Thr protein kinase)